MKRHDLGKIVADVMSTSVVEASPDMSVWQAAATMERKGIKRLPVVDDDDYLLGIIFSEPTSSKRWPVMTIGSKKMWLRQSICGWTLRRSTASRSR